MSERWVINASPVILLSKAGVVGLLPAICTELVVPEAVINEVSKGAAGDAGRLWLDDRQGRIWAKRLGLTLIGSLGAVVALKQRRLIPAAGPVLEKVRAADGFVSAAAIRAALNEADEA